MYYLGLWRFNIECLSHFFLTEQLKPSPQADKVRRDDRMRPLAPHQRRLDLKPSAVHDLTTVA